MLTCLDSYYFSRLRVTVRAKELVRIPGFKGSTIHGALGHALLKTVCAMHYKTCDPQCMLYKNGHCFYQYVYETRVPKELAHDPAIRNRGGKQPSPLVISMIASSGNTHGSSETYTPGQTFEFEMVLIGRATEFTPYLVYALEQMCRHGIGKGRAQCSLDAVYILELKGNPVRIYGDGILHPELGTIRFRDAMTVQPGFNPQDTVTLNFLTRLELKARNRFTRINFDALFRRLLARVVTTARLHCGIDCSSVDFKALCAQARDIETVSSTLAFENAHRYSNRQKRRTPFGGVTGKITFKGNLKPFWPVLRLGEIIHMGKKTGFGFGKYQIQINSILDT